MSELRSSRVDSETASFYLELGRLTMPAELCWSRDVLVLLFFKQSTDELKAEPPGFSWLAFLLETLSSTTGKANLGLLDTILSWLLAFLLRQSIDKVGLVLFSVDFYPAQKKQDISLLQ